MRILMTTSTFPVGLDEGTPRFVYDLAQSLAAHEEVMVLAPHSPGAAEHEKLGSLEVQRFPYFWPSSLEQLTPRYGLGMRELVAGNWLAKCQIPLFLLQQARTLCRLVRDRGIDLINAHWLVPQGLVAAVARDRTSRAPLVIHVHAGDLFLLCRLRFGRALARYIVGRSSALFADSSHVRDCLDDLVGFPTHARVQPMGFHGQVFVRPVVPLPVPEGTPPFPAGFLLFVGRFVEKKGTMYLLRAMSKVSQVKPGLGLVLVGSGPEEPQLRREAERLGLQHVVHFAGARPHSEVVRYLHACKLAVVPSIVDSRGETEGMPTVVVEMMAAGALVLGSAVAGIPDVIRHEENGWLCPPRDPEALATAILGILQTPDHTTLLQQAQETAREYEWQQVARNYLQTLQPLCSREQRKAS